MLRDTRKTAGYFQEYIAYQKARIEKFEGVLGQAAGKERQCHMYLTNFYQDLLLAEYSAGEDAAALKQTYLHYLAHARTQGALPYDTASHVLAWAVLLNAGSDGVLEGVEYPEDGLLEAMAQYVRGNWPVLGLETMPALTRESERLLSCLTGNRGAEQLKAYLENDWYADNRGAAWYGSSLREDGTYCGYWCLTGGAVIKIAGWNPCLFADAPYCPVDLLV